MIANAWSERRGALSGLGDPARVALSFDDGPDPTSTQQMLGLLDALDVRATFFVLASMLARHPDVGRAVVAAGHEVGGHAGAIAPSPCVGRPRPVRTSPASSA